MPWRVALTAALALSLPYNRDAIQDRALCFAFLRGGDVIVACGGREDRITRQGNVESFAISDERSGFGVVTSRITKRTPGAAYVASTATLVDLKSGGVTQADGTGALVSTCGGLFWLMDASRQRSDVRDLLSGDAVSTLPYSWFRCSSDRKVVAGMVKASGDDVYEGVPPRVEVAPAASASRYVFNISPDGSKVAYTSDTHPLCVFSLGRTQCASDEAVDTSHDLVSVRNSGEVLVARETPEVCFYKNPTSFSTIRAPGTSPESCLGIGYWKPGVKSFEIVEPVGRAPQWISPLTAGLLRDWAARGAVGPHR